MFETQLVDVRVELPLGENVSAASVTDTHPPTYSQLEQIFLKAFINQRRLDFVFLLTEVTHTK
jgi:hypothetical protein